MACQIRVGDTASLTRTLSDDDIARFAQLTGDTNPVHLDDAVAARTRFGGRVAHGMLAAGLVSAVIGTRLPGPGAIYLGQDLRFRDAVRPGDTLVATVTVEGVRPDKPILTLRTVCTNQRGATVLEGQAVVLFEPIPDLP